MPERAFLCRFWTFVFLHQKQKTKGMEHQKTSYDTLPERIDYLIIPEELDKWCEDKIQTVSHEENELQLLIKSPLNKWKKKV